MAPRGFGTRSNTGARGKFRDALADAPRDDIPAHEEVRAAIDKWWLKASSDRRGGSADSASTLSAAPDGAGQPFVMHDFQEEFARFAVVMQRLLGPGQP